VRYLMASFSRQRSIACFQELGQLSGTGAFDEVALISFGTFACRFQRPTLQSSRIDHAVPLPTAPGCKTGAGGQTISSMIYDFVGTHWFNPLLLLAYDRRDVLSSHRISCSPLHNTSIKATRPAKQSQILPSPLSIHPW